MNEFFLLMKHELVLTVLIFLLLFIRIGKGMKNESLLSLIQVLLLVSLLIGFFFNKAVLKISVAFRLVCSGKSPFIIQS